jgi:O-antigen/teichoic acid export membrane protein
MARYAGATLVGSLITLIVFRRSEFLLLAHYADDREIAMYSVAFGSVAMLLLVPEGFARAVSPAVATLVGAGANERIRVGYSRALRLLLLAAVPVTAFTVALGPTTVRLVFGDEFAGTRTPLLILLVPLPLIPLMNVSYSLVVGFGKARFPLVVGFGSVALNIALDFALIPRHGAVGAAVANACAQGATALATIAYGSRLVGQVRWEPSTLVRASAVSVAAGVTAWLVGRSLGGVAGLVAGLCAGAAVFAGLGAGVKIIARDDVGWLESTFGTRIGLVARRLGAKS